MDEADRQRPPAGTYGRIALDVSRSNPNVVYAQIEAGDGTPMPGAARSGRRPKRPRRRGGRAGAPRSIRRAAAQRRRRAATAGRGTAAPAAAAAAAARRRLQLVQQRRPGAAARSRRAAPPRARSRLAAASSAPRTRASGWTHVSNCNSRPMYFSQIRVDPTNDKAVYVAGLPIGEVARRRQDVRDAGRGGRRTAIRATSISTRSGSIRRTRSTS